MERINSLKKIVFLGRLLKQGNFLKSIHVVSWSKSAGKAFMFFYASYLEPEAFKHFQVIA